MRALKVHYPYRYFGGDYSEYIVACGAVPHGRTTKDKRRVTCGNCLAVLKRRANEAKRRK